MWRKAASYIGCLNSQIGVFMLVAPCGVVCDDCPHAESCGGSCHASCGKPFYIKEFGLEVCPLFDCAVNKKGYQTCAECTELPCQLFYDWKDPSMTEEAHLQSISDRVALLKAH